MVGRLWSTRSTGCYQLEGGGRAKFEVKGEGARSLRWMRSSRDNGTGQLKPVDLSECIIFHLDLDYCVVTEYSYSMHGECR